MMRSSWVDHISNGEVLLKAREYRSLTKLIRERHSDFLAHIIEKEQLEEIITTGRLEGKKGEEDLV